MLALVVALAFVAFAAGMLCSRLVQRLAPFAAAALVGAVVQAGTGDWNVTISGAGVLLVAAAFVSSTRDLLAILRTSA